MNFLHRLLQFKTTIVAAFGIPMLISLLTLIMLTPFTGELQALEREQSQVTEDSNAKDRPQEVLV